MNPHAGKSKVVIAGGSGFIGVSLAGFLVRHGWQVTLLSRHAPRVAGPWKFVAWDARSPGAWQQELEQAAGLVNLVGRSVDCIKTPDHQDEILRSRVEATEVLGRALRALDSPPRVWVQMSTAHIYGDPPQIICHEDSPLGYGLAPHVGRAWEAAFRESVLPEQRGVLLRTSFVIGRDQGAGGGALRRLKLLVRLGLGGTIGTGNQGMSWIHETDLHRLCEYALLQDSMAGVYVASSPHPVAQREFMRELRQAMRVPFGLPAAPWMVRFGARWFLHTDPELALYGRYVTSQRLASTGFDFRFPKLRAALDDLLRPAPRTHPGSGVWDE